MAITAIGRYFVGDPNIVAIVTTDDLATITTAGYITAQQDNIEAIQNGEFQWTDTDIVLMYYSPAQIGFFVYDAVNATFDALAPSGGLADTLQSGDIFVGNVSNVATGVPVTGDVLMSNAGVTSIAAGVIVNADINAAAAIAFSKLAALPSTQILVGSAGNVATAVTVTGDVTISNTGVTAIAAGVIVNADISNSAAIAFSKLATLATGHILAGNAGVVTDVTVSGDITIGATGVTAIGAGKVLLAMLGTGIAPEAFAVAGALAASDRAFVQIVNNGTNNVTVLQAVVTNDTLTITFSGDPSNDTVFNYQIIRAAA